jgi:hypothetical protein
MSQSIALTPLICPNCATPIPANADEIAWVCAQCRQCYLLNHEDRLVPLQIQYQQRTQDVECGFPYWVTTAKVDLLRETLRGNLTKDSLQFWQNPRTVFIPAYSTEMEALLKKAEALIKNPPVLFSAEMMTFKPVILSLVDLRAYVEFLVMQIEADRQDNLKQLTFELQLSDPVLWILPE